MRFCFAGFLLLSSSVNIADIKRCSRAKVSTCFSANFPVTINILTSANSGTVSLERNCCHSSRQTAGDVSSSMGVFTKNKGLSWEQNPTDLIKSVITTFHVYEFGPLGNRLVVGTQMQGAYYIGNFEEFSPVKEQPLATIPEVRLSPNPASDHITIEIEKESNDCRIDLYDLCGSNVGTFNVNGGRSTVRTDNLSSGVYTMRVQYGNKTASKTIAIIK